LPGRYTYKATPTPNTPTPTHPHTHTPTPLQTRLRAGVSPTAARIDSLPEIYTKKSMSQYIYFWIYINSLYTVTFQNSCPGLGFSVSGLGFRLPRRCRRRWGFQAASRSWTRQRRSRQCSHIAPWDAPDSHGTWHGRARSSNRSSQPRWLPDSSVFRCA